MVLHNTSVVQDDINISSHYLETSQQRVIRQLIEAILFEGIVEFDYYHGEFIFFIGNTQYRAPGYIGSFGRIRLEHAQLKQQKESNLIEPTIDHIVNNLAMSDRNKQVLSHELTQTIVFTQWNKDQQTHCLSKQQSRRHLSYATLESAIDEGHPYHPCFKARTGFSLQDHQDYSPENANTFQLRWLAVQRSFVAQQLEPIYHSGIDNNHIDNDSGFWQNELGIDTWAVLQQAIANKHITWEEYTLIPMHPWQWHKLSAELSEPLEKSYFVDLGYAGDFYQASISVRTLLNISHPEKANIKLPMNMVNSSSLRTLETHSICTAPFISQWLSRIIHSDDFFNSQQALGFLQEYAGIVLKDDNAIVTQHPWMKSLIGQLGVIFRESIDASNISDTLIPFVAVTVIEMDNKPFIHPWIEQYGCKAWLSQLIDVTVIPVWHLLVHHGIAVEAHAQNMILTHRNGWPEKITLRDFHESLEYVESFLSEPNLQPDFTQLHPSYTNAKNNQFYWMNDVDLLKELFVDTLFVFNLSDLATLCERYYQFSEFDFWQLVSQRLQVYQYYEVTSIERISNIDLYKPSIRAESLIQKKLSADSAQGQQQEFHHNVNNPLSAFVS